jgi:ribosomal 30S subunit maturation factor RimM
MDLENNEFLLFNDLRDLKVITQRPQDLGDVIMIDDFLKFQKINNEPTD